MEYLRKVNQEDVLVFFDHQRDLEARHMAAFTSEDRNDIQSFISHWQRLLNDESVLLRTIATGDGQVVGSIGSYVDAEFGAPQVTYWIGKEYWGMGIASGALGIFLRIQSVRPLYARLAKDNSRSLKVLETNGFQVIREDAGFAAARGTNIEELVMILNSPG